jgi:murein L,D-transpeptidase YcbB/YkuD
VPRAGALLAAGWLALAPVAGLAAAVPVVEAIRERVDLERDTGQLRIGGREVVSRVNLPAIYDERGFEPLWHDPARVDELIGLIEDSYADGLLPVDYHLTALLRLQQAVLVDPSPGNAADLDILATDAFMLLLYHLYFGKVDPKAVAPTWNFPARRIDGRSAATFVTEAIASGRLREALDAVRPQHWMYEHGRGALAAYRRIAANGGWPTVPQGETLKPGMTDPRVAALRRRLEVTGDLVGEPSDSWFYDEVLADAVRSFQERHLLTPDAAVGKATLAELNVPVADRIRQIRVNLERGRQILHEIGDDDLVIVDIAGYEVRYVHDRRVTWSSRVVVGQPYRQTPIFQAQIEYVVFNPTWTVPPGILQKDILPAVRKDPGYLAKRGLKIVDRNGRAVDPSGIDWHRYTGNSFPWFVRQEPGPENALGRVKIMFPNPHLVYLHDTPSRSLFEKDDRAFSSGCIRVQRPFELVELLLADPAWDQAALDAAVASGETRTVRLARPVRVLLIYWTVDEDDAGRIVFKRDIYDRDPALARALDARFAFGSRPEI